ncbi:MAG: hypothetical protein R3350_03290, partial [Saprospiraceae bacterium]|nr:hypothetical protein [Saprospiraceae bacterium]
APDRVYNIYNMLKQAPVSIIGLERICADPWTYPNLLRTPEFIAEVEEDGRFVDFLKHYGILQRAALLD